MILWMGITIALRVPYFKLIEAATRKVAADAPLPLPGLSPVRPHLRGPR